MLTDFALDLQAVRRKSGLSQEDIATLLAIDQSTFSEIERGAKQPSVRQLYELSLIFGRSFQCVYDELDKEVRPALARRMKRLPQKKRGHLTAFNRTFVLKRLRRRLNLDSKNYGRA